jgi:transposase
LLNACGPNLSAFQFRPVQGIILGMVPEQKSLIGLDPPNPGFVLVNDRVSFTTEGSERVVSVHGVIFAHYDINDRPAAAYAMVSLIEAGYATQVEVSRGFQVSARTLRRYQERLEKGGLTEIARAEGRPAEHGPDLPRRQRRDQMIVRLKEKGFSNRAIAGKLGVSEKMVRKRLRFFGWTAPAAPSLGFDEFPQEHQSLPDASSAERPTSDVSTPGPEMEPSDKARGGDEPDSVIASFDFDPLNRSMDRLLAAMGLIDDAAPLFAECADLPRAGVLLAVPALVESGLLSVARRIYGSIGPAFYGLRTCLVSYVLLALLRIPRPENLKEYAPDGLGRIVGLDRMPEVKTMRRKLARLASRKGSQDLGREMAKHRIRKRGRMVGFLYLDGHVRVYHGKKSVAKGYDTRRRLAVPATTDYWLNDRTGDPLFVVTAEANSAMTKMLVPVLEQVRELIGPKRRITIVFDRAGWSPKLFKQILDLNFDILTYRKGRVRRIAENRFSLQKAKLDGRKVEYWLHDQPVRFLKGKLRLRQITRLKDGHQTPVLTSRWDLRDIHIAYRMFARWRQENFFKYLRQEFSIDALTDYDAEPDDPDRLVPNPSRKDLDKQIRAARAELTKLRQTYGSTALAYLEDRGSTMRSFTKEEKRIRKEIGDIRNKIDALVARRKAMPTHVPLSDVDPGGKKVRLSSERKHLTNVLKMVAYQIEGDLVELIRPHYAKAEDEGRTLIQAALQSAASITPTKNDLHVVVSPLSSPHRSKAIATLCEALNLAETKFPGTKLTMRFSVMEPPNR